MRDLRTPAQVSSPDRLGRLPLHCAAGGSASEEVIAHLLSVHEAAASIDDGSGRLPLHHAAGRPPPQSLALLDKLIKAFPEVCFSLTMQRTVGGIDARDNNHATPTPPRPPQGIRSRDASGRLPVHVLAAAEPTPEALSLLLTAFPSSVRAALSVLAPPLVQSSLPVTFTECSFVCLVHSPPRVLRPHQPALSPKPLSPFRLQCMEADISGKLPVHVAAWQRADPLALRILLDVCPQAAAVRDHIGFTPLHWAVGHSASLPSVAMLLDSHPAALREKGGPAKSLPLHVAAASGATGEVVALLLARCPEAVMVPDAQHFLPLHLACERPAAAEVVAQILAAHPEGPDTLSAGVRPLATWMRSVGSAERSEAAAAFERLVTPSGKALRAAIHDVAPYAEFAGLIGRATAADPTLPYVPESQDAPGTPLEALQVACPECRREMLGNGYLLRRYSITLPAFSESASSLLFHATDTQADNSFHRRVVLKFCRRRDNFLAEARARDAIIGSPST